ncbi:MAG TPA: FHA domain-containing protein [Streptosporangiaceae bacterium]|nr:FHA domain-containing protein [Streptosporangiaceae bacterium]
MAAAPFEHAEQARLALRTIVAEHGPDMLSRPRALANLLADLLPDAPRIARILVAAAEDHVADDLREHTADGMDIATASRLVASAFTSATLIASDACTWAVAEFALAIGLISEPEPEPDGDGVGAGVGVGQSSLAPSMTAKFRSGAAHPGEPGSTQPYNPEDDLSAPTPAPVRPSPRRDPRGFRRPTPIKAPFPIPPEQGAVEGEPVGEEPVGEEPAEAAPSVRTTIDDPAVEPADEPEAVPEPEPEPAGPAESRPRSQTKWVAVVTADREYFDDVVADGHMDAASIEFPSYCPERRFQLSGTEMQIGRRSRSRKLEPEIDLTGPPTDPGISHLHAAFVAADDGTWSVLDRGSANGTQVNGREIEVGEAVELHDGDRVCIGAWTTLTVHAG